MQRNFHERPATIGRVKYFLDFNCFIPGAVERDEYGTTTTRDAGMSRVFIDRLCQVYGIEDKHSPLYYPTSWDDQLRHRLAVAISRAHSTMGEVIAAVHLLRE